MELICTPCGEPVEEGTSFVIAEEIEGKLVWRWSCKHHPPKDSCKVILASGDCVDDYLMEHPEQMEQVAEVVNGGHGDHASTVN